MENLPQTDATTNAKLLRELGAAHARAGVTDERAGELLRLAADPLLLRDHLRREPTPPEKSPLQSELTLLLAPFGVARRSDGMPAAVTAYVRVEPRHPNNSLRPEIFRPTIEDREGALPDQPTSSPSRPSANIFVRWVVAAVFGSFLLLLWLARQ